MRKPPVILDTTLRDGSYAVHFCFSCTDQRRITTKLEDLGIDYIEIGHGMGLNASSYKNGVALQTDTEYLAEAQRSLKRAKYGFFCIPEVARLDDIDMAHNYGASFIRVGTNVTEVPTSEPFIQRAKKLGMTVMSNYMKSYSASPSEFAEAARLSVSYGTDIIYLVDSAGGMFGEDIRAYYEPLKYALPDIRTGFHAHDNLGLAISNSLLAADLGFDFVDCSLQGLGRSSGNAALEIYAAALQKKGYPLPIDIFELQRAGKQLVQPFSKKKQIEPLDVICGFASFHTSYMSSIHKISTKYEVDPLELIVAYTEVDVVGMDEVLLAQIAQTLSPRQIVPGDYDFTDYFGSEQMRHHAEEQTENRLSAEAFSGSYIKDSAHESGLQTPLQ
ncbi:MAG: 4-hydroxy-2-oxovalerate aldolase [Peptococcaceae bacterium]|nr:4-hydroxy-2-oxovalerate aldolase [Peptococcaceae bacterium]